MIYLLKFGASFVLPPGIFFLTFWGLGIYVWRQRKKRVASLLLVLTTCFYLLSTSFVSESLLSSLEGKYAPPVQPQGDVIVMLGGGALPDTPDLDGTGTLTSSPSARLLEVYRLYRQLQVPIVLSGGQVYADSGQEAVIARRVLMSMGVPETDIFIEGQSLTTGQNARYSAKLLAEHGWKAPLLVTSAFHMERAVLNFAHANVAVTPCPTDYFAARQSVFHYNKLSPSAAALSGTVVFLQEKLRTFVTRHFE